MGIYGAVFGKWVQPAYERLKGRSTYDHLAELERTQWLSPWELEAYQGRALRRLVDHCAQHVPHYRDLLASRGLTPADFSLPRDLDLAQIPILDKNAARLIGDARKSTGVPGCDIEKLTGGTTGEPMRFGLDLGSEQWRHAMKLRGWGWSGYNVGDPTLYFWGPATTRKPSARQRAKVAADRALKREFY